MVKKKSASSNAVRQAETSVRAIRARTKKLLKNAQLDIKQYRKQVSTLKKQGIVSKRIHAGKHQPTRYMLSKLKQFKPVALGHELAIPLLKLSPHRARQYTEKGIARQVGKFLTVPKTAAKQKADIYKGNIRRVTRMRQGEERIITFPTRLEDMHDVLVWLKQNEAMLNEQLGPNSQFGFQISGNNSIVGAGSIRELILYLQRYNGTDPRERGNIFNGDSHEIVKEFVLMEFVPAKGKVGPSLEPYYGVKRHSKHYGKRRKDIGKYEHIRLENARKRRASLRMAESIDESEARLAKQREYDRARANIRREQRMAKKLLGD